MAVANRRNNSIFDDNVGYIIKPNIQKIGEYNHTILFLMEIKCGNDKYKGDQIRRVL